MFFWNDIDPGTNEYGWSFKLGLGISPLIGGHLTVPVELGFVTENLTNEHPKGESFTHTDSRIFLEVGIGAFFW